jgi:hypothetical protein
MKTIQHTMSARPIGCNRNVINVLALFWLALTPSEKENPEPAAEQPLA